MKLNWFSPLPPAPSGIADYVWQVLPHLAAHAEITLWTNQAEWDERLEQHAQVRQFGGPQAPWLPLNQADMTIYHLGNNRDFHTQIWEISCHHPGIVVLHDSVLHHLFAGIYLVDWCDEAGYLDLLRRYHGEAGHAAGLALIGGRRDANALARQFPLTLAALETALGVMVHSGESLAALRATGRWPMTLADLPLAAGAAAGDATPRERRLDGVRRLIVFGHLWPNRRLEQVVRALARLESRHRVRLDIYGRVSNWPHLAQLCAQLGVDGLVTFHGYVSEPDLRAALDRADLAINLRHPSMGEASFSQLAIWRHALPSLVTAGGWLSDIPSDLVAFVDPHREIEDIVRHLRSFLADPDSWSSMGRRARQHLEQRHDPARYTRQLIELAAEGIRFRVEAEILMLAQRIALDISRWAHPAARRIVARRGAGELLATLR